MLLRQTLLYLPAQVMGPIFALISAFAWTHYLTPPEMGSFALVSAAQELAFSTTLMWFSLYTVRYFDTSAHPDETRAFYGTECAIMLAASVAMALAMAVLPLGPDGRLTGPLLAAAIAFVVSRSIVAYLCDRARAEGDTLTYTVLQTGGPVGGFFIALVLVKVWPSTASTVLAGYAMAQIASLVFAALRLTWSADPRAGSWQTARAALSYGVLLFFGGLLIWVANNGVRFLIEWHEGLAAVGLVTVGWALGLRAAQFASMLTTAAAFPLAVRTARTHGMAAGQAQLIANGVLLVAALAPAIAGLYVIAPALIDLIIAADYRPVTQAVLPMALVTGGVRAVRLHFVNQVFLLHEKPLIPVMNDAIDAGLTLLFGALGLTLGGLAGCVMGVMIASSVTLALGMTAAWRTYDYRFPLLDLLRIGTATVAMGWVVAHFGAQPKMGSLIAAVALGGWVYVIAMAMLYPAATARLAKVLQPHVWPTAVEPALSEAPSTPLPAVKSESPS